MTTLPGGGELLLSYARRLLALNDEATLALSERQLAGNIRTGMQEDFAESLPRHSSTVFPGSSAGENLRKYWA